MHHLLRSSRARNQHSTCVHSAEGEFLVARDVEGGRVRAVDRGGMLARGMAELGDILLHFVLMGWCKGRGRQALEDVWNQTGDRL
jgi:hypothetical protein